MSVCQLEALVPCEARVPEHARLSGDRGPVSAWAPLLHQPPQLGPDLYKYREITFKLLENMDAPNLLDPEHHVPQLCTPLRGSLLVPEYGLKDGGGAACRAAVHCPQYPGHLGLQRGHAPGVTRHQAEEPDTVSVQSKILMEIGASSTSSGSGRIFYLAK